ncbi:asparagine synthase family protein [Sodalis sp. RH21]|uniref:asparagine synthase family protein n=1 Tax=unclassified Sodalis (in: enterobacteria) TaxID=2636512 RepID=UPI0039B4B0E2
MPIDIIQSKYCGLVKNLRSGLLFIGGNTSFYTHQFATGTAYLIGNIHNRDFLTSLAGHFEGQAYAMNNATCLYLLQERFGDAALALAEGDFCFIIESQDGFLTIITDPHGFRPIYRVDNGGIWITDRLKFVGAVKGEDAFDFYPADAVCRDNHYPDSYLPIHNARRLKPGTLNYLTYDTQDYACCESRIMVAPASNEPLKLARDPLLALIDCYLNTPLASLGPRYGTAGIPLSGGLDSSLITALAKRHFHRIKTYSIGTGYSNEFEFSQQVADTLKTEHRVHILSGQEVIRGIAEAIYHNEIFDGLSAEIQSGLFNVYRLAQHEVKCMLTGYGSDILFGGILQPGKHYEQPNRLLAAQVYRTRWTGEFSSGGARHYGLEIYHPFWRTNLITLCHALDPHFKIRDNEVKVILREYADQLHSLPPEIVWRRKIGIHEGSSLNRAFANMLGSEIGDYRAKTRAAYAMYRTFLTGNLTVDDMTPARVAALFKGV